MPTLRTLSRSLATIILSTGVAAAATVEVPVGANIQEVVNANPEGTTFRIKRGLHRLQEITPKHGQVFVGEVGAVLSGARLLTSFQREGEYWVATGQTQQGQVHGDGAPGCPYPEDLFFDDQPLEHVRSLAEVVAGKWFFDYAADKIYFRDDHAGRRVETGVARRAFGGSANDVVIRNLTIEKYAIPGQMGAIGDQIPGDRWVIEGCETRLNHGLGIVLGNGGRAIACYAHDNGHTGIGSRGAFAFDQCNDQLVEATEISGNNYAKFVWGWSAGGAKFAMTKNLVFRGNNVHSNGGPGLWTDISCRDTTYEDNLIWENEQSGIMHEISYAAVIRRNRVLRNCKQLDPDQTWMYGAQIHVSISQDTEVYDNDIEVAASGGTGITVSQQDRPAHDPRVFGDLLAKNVRVHHNTMIFRGTRGHTGLAQDLRDNPAGSEAVFASQGNSFDWNTYISPSLADRHWAWMNGNRNWNDFRAYGQEANGSASSAVPASDLTLPGGSVTSPVPGSTVNGVVAFTVAPSDDRGVSHVRFLVDGHHVGLAYRAPWTVNVDTAGMADGQHTWSAVVTDTAGNSRTISGVAATGVPPANRAPTITTSDPVSLSVVAGASACVALAASDTDGDALSWSIQSQGSQGVASVTGSGALSYTANAGASGADSVVARVSDGRGGSDTITVAVAIAAPSSSGSGSGSILREWWTGVDGYSVAQIPTSTAPTGSSQATSFEAPIDWAEHYATRMRGYVHAPVTGSYTFWISGDDNCELWLSTSDSWGAKVRIATVPGWTNSREWDKYGEQRSATVTLQAGTRYYIEALQKEQDGGDSLAVAWQGPGIARQVIAGSYLSPVTIGGAGVILREWWTGISGTAVAQIPVASAPTGSSLPTSFEAPTNWAERYGTRMRGLVHPPVTGSYTFWVSGDDNCELWLSTSDRTAAKQRIATVPGWTNAREWARYPEQRSAAVTLQAGAAYYIEALQKEEGGGDSLTVAWQGPGIGQQVIPGACLSPAPSTMVASGGILREWWSGITGTSVAQIPVASAPTGSSRQTSFEAPANWGDEYGTRMRGYLHPAATGSYTFWIAGDDNCELWLSSSDNSAAKLRIARVSSSTGSRQWNAFPEQRSAAVTLQGGARYSIEALQKEQGGGDCLAVAWQGPGIAQQVIAGAFLSPAEAGVGGGTLPDGWTCADIGGVAVVGSSRADAGIFTIAGSGADIWGQADEFQYAWRRLDGDGQIVARVISVTATDPWAKAGVMIREVGDASARHAFMAVTPGNGVSFQRRTVAGGPSDHTQGPAVGAPTWLRLERIGDTVAGYQSSNGSTWQQVGSVSIPMGAVLRIGLAVTSHNDGTVCSGVFDQVSVVSSSPGNG
ncbi:MAG: right-handed parallel beta-helix repeat-containing protein [Planctomycetes bacterium]|nr:right-handed parallel beta-helix repeat-containing protein [Planctomycetota bacterium]